MSGDGTNIWGRTSTVIDPSMSTTIESGTGRSLNKDDLVEAAKKQAAAKPDGFVLKQAGLSTVEQKLEGEACVDTNKDGVLEACYTVKHLDPSREGGSLELTFTDTSRMTISPPSKSTELLSADDPAISSIVSDESERKTMVQHANQGLQKLDEQYADLEEDIQEGEQHLKDMYADGEDPDNIERKSRELQLKRDSLKEIASKRDDILYNSFSSLSSSSSTSGSASGSPVVGLMHDTETIPGGETPRRAQLIREGLNSKLRDFDAQLVELQNELSGLEKRKKFLKKVEAHDAANDVEDKIADLKDEMNRISADREGVFELGLNIADHPEAIKEITGGKVQASNAEIEAAAAKRHKNRMAAVTRGLDYIKKPTEILGAVTQFKSAVDTLSGKADIDKRKEKLFQKAIGNKEQGPDYISQMLNKKDNFTSGFESLQKASGGGQDQKQEPSLTQKLQALEKKPKEKGNSRLERLQEEAQLTQAENTVNEPLRRNGVRGY